VTYGQTDELTQILQLGPTCVLIIASIELESGPVRNFAVQS